MISLFATLFASCGAVTNIVRFDTDEVDLSALLQFRFSPILLHVSAEYLRVLYRCSLA